jgi:hypothetical protein
MVAAPSDLTAAAQSHHPVQVRPPLVRPPLAEPPPQACSHQPPWPPADLRELQPAETREPAAARNWSAATRRCRPQARPMPQPSWPPADFRGTAGTAETMDLPECRHANPHASSSWLLTWAGPTIRPRLVGWQPPRPATTVAAPYATQNSANCC